MRPEPEIPRIHPRGGANKHGAIVDLELEGDTGLFYCSNAGGLDTDRAVFDTRQERDEALLRTVRLYLDEGWQLVGEEG